MKTKIKKILLQMCLMDDTFMTVAMDGNTEAISHIISTVLQRKVNIVSVITQKKVHNTRGKKIVMDIFAMDDHGNVYVIETENNPTRAKGPRMQYYSDMVSNIIVQTGTAYSQIKNRTVICLTRGDAAKTGQPVSRSITEWKDTDRGTKPYGQIVYVNVRENRGNDRISVLCRELVQKDYRKITDPILRESCRRTKEGDRKEVMCDKIRQLQAETRKEERARAAQRKDAEKGSGTCQAGCGTGKKQLSAWDGRSQDSSRNHQQYSAYECGCCQKAGIVAWVCSDTSKDAIEKRCPKKHLSFGLRELKSFEIFFCD